MIIEGTQTFTFTETDLRKVLEFVLRARTKYLPALTRENADVRAEVDADTGLLESISITVRLPPTILEPMDD